MFKYLKSLKSDQYPPSITNGTAHAEKDIDKAEMFNKHFCSIVCDPTLTSYQPSDLTIFGPIDLAFTKKDIIKELNVLRINKSRGPDQLPPLVMKNTANNISPSLFTIFSNLKRLSKFPSSWKHCVVTPIFKDGSKKDVKNYRPITLLSICSKVFEKLIFNCPAGHFMSTTTDSQFGFLPRRSAILQLIRGLPIFTPRSVTPVVQSCLYYLTFRRHSTRSNTMFYYVNSSVLVYQGNYTYFWLTTFQIALNL